MSNCFEHDLLKYVRTRFPVWLALTLPGLISAAALWGTFGKVGLESVVIFILAMLLVFQFRLWDDLVDREVDRVRCPDRILCQTSAIPSFQRLFGFLAVINLCAVAICRPWWSVTALLFLHLLLAMWYWGRDRSSVDSVIRNPVLNYHIVLSKYPAFVLILGAASRDELARPLFISAFVVYLALCLFEVLHDFRLRRLPSAWAALSMELVLLLAVI